MNASRRPLTTTTTTTGRNAGKQRARQACLQQLRHIEKVGNLMTYISPWTRRKDDDWSRFSRQGLVLPTYLPTDQPTQEVLEYLYPASVRVNLSFKATHSSFNKLTTNNETSRPSGTCSRQNPSYLWSYGRHLGLLTILVLYLNAPGRRWLWTTRFCAQWPKVQFMLDPLKERSTESGHWKLYYI